MKVKRIAFLLALITLLSSFAGVHTASAEDGIDKKYEILCSLGFFDGKSRFAEKASVTRGDIITAITSALPESYQYDVSTAESTGFSDVGIGDPIAQTAFTAYNLKLLGNQTELRASDIAGIEDASFILLNLLGYNTVAGDNPAAFAQGIGLTKGVGDSLKLSMGGFVKMLYNALETEILQRVFTDGKIVMETVPGDTFMKEVLGVGSLKGQVTAGRYAAVNGESPTYRDCVVINGTEYKSGRVSGEDFLGTVVEFYYREDKDSGDRELLYIELADEKRVLTIDAQRIRKYEDMVYTYEPGEASRVKTEKISRTSTVIYNGKLISGVFENYKPADGYVKLIDNDGDNVNEIVVILDFKSVTVSGVDLTTGTINDFYHPENVYEVPLYDDGMAYNIRNFSGEPGKFQDIDKNHTIFIAESQDKELITIITSDESIIGSVSAINEEEIIINDISYEPTADLLASERVKSRSYGRFYLDPLGRVAYFESLGELGVLSGVMTKAIYDPDTDSLMLTIFTENGAFERLYTAEKLYYINGKSANPERTKAEDPEEMLTLLNSAKDINLGGCVFMLYKLNGQGEIKELELPAEYTTSLEREDKLNENEILRQDSQKLKEVHKSGLFGFNHRLGPDTKTFMIPNNIADKEDFEFYTGITGGFAWREEYTSIGYKKKYNSSYSDYVIGFGKGSGGELDEYNVFIVQRVANGLNEDDEIIKTIVGKWAGADAEFTLDSSLSETDIGSGDILRLSVTDKGEVTRVLKVMDYSSMALERNGARADMYAHFIGRAYDFMGTTLRLCFKDPSEVTDKADIANVWADNMATVYKFNTDTKEITATSYSTIKTSETHGNSASMVYAQFHYGDHQLMVIYE